MNPRQAASNNKENWRQKMAMSRRRSAPVANTNYDSDEDQIEYLNYNESKYYGYVDDFPSPVQVKRPNPKYKRPSEAVHIAVWDNDPALIQHLVLYKGIKFSPPFLKKQFFVYEF